MKFNTAFITISIISSWLYSSCQSESKPTPVVVKNNETIQPLLKIGGCYAIEVKKDSLACITVIRVNKEEDKIYYSFFIGGKFFSTIPSSAEFRMAGLWGREIPGPETTTLGLDMLTIDEKSLIPALDKFHLIETISVSKKNLMNVGSSAYIDTLEDIIQHIQFFPVHNSRIKEEKNPLLKAYPYQVYSWENIAIATDPSDIVQPEITWRLSPKTAHPQAAELMQEDWYWSEIDDLSPFGNDDGNDAFYLFKEWREKNPSVEPSVFLIVLEKKWQMSFAHKAATNENELPAIEKQNMFYRNIDRSIIAVALGQIVLEGKISPRLKELGIKAIKRAMTSYGMNDMQPAAMAEYKKRFEKIMTVINHF
jgi:uncharacterized protein YfeS